MRKIVLLLATAIVILLASVSKADAITSSLQMTPLLYDETLAKGEKKKGFIDISNPTAKSVLLQTSVQGFRQIDNNGSLEFFDNEQINAGVMLDLDEFELGPKEALRLYFLVDGTKLPEGDVFAAIFVSTKGNQESRGVAEAVKLGTILTIVNGTPGTRNATIESISAPMFQFGSIIKGAYIVKNTADPNDTTGFYPEVTVAVTPFGQTSTAKSPLVMAGKTREGNFGIEGDRFGIYSLSAEFENSKQSRIVFVMTGYWQWLAPVLLIFGILIALFPRMRRGKKRYYKAR